MHPWVKPFWSQLEVMDYTVSQRLKGLQKRGDNSNAQHRCDRQQAALTRRRMGTTPETDQTSILKRGRRNTIRSEYASDDVVDIRLNVDTSAHETIVVAG